VSSDQWLSGKIEVKSQESASFPKLHRSEKILVVGARCTWRQIERGSELSDSEYLSCVVLWVDNSRRPKG
jgi:hypothetical protein